jgi:hypothetical protein
MDESSASQNRRSRRSNVLMSATVEFDGSLVKTKLRNLSKEGALVEGDGLPAIGQPVKFRKGEPLDPDSVLRHVPAPRPKMAAEHRRPRLRGQELTPGERKIAEDWIFGSPLPQVGD